MTIYKSNASIELCKRPDCAESRHTKQEFIDVKNHNAAMCAENARLVADNNRLRKLVDKHDSGIESLVDEAQDNLDHLKDIAVKLDKQSLRQRFVNHTKNIQRLMSEFKLR
jgi:regulator of replication initiation timing